MNQLKPAPVVIVGGGFAGVTLAMQLEKRLPANVEIIVVSRDNHLVFTPMLAEVAARTISPLHIVVAGRQMTRRTRWIAATIKHIEVENQCVRFDLTYGGEMSQQYGDLVLACGMDVNLNSVPGMEAWAHPLKSIDDAFRLGNLLVQRFEQAALETDPSLQRRLLTTVVIGGGFSGVEIGGHLHDLAQTMRPFYKFADGVKPRTIIVQRGARLLPELQHVGLSEFTLRRMTLNGLRIRLNSEVHEIGNGEVHLKTGERLEFGLLVGTIGNMASPFIKSSGLPMEHNRLVALGTMQVTGHAHIWALGDCATVPNAFDGKPSPPTAQFALRQAKQLAKNLVKARHGQALADFRFRPQGLLASIGQRNGVAEILGLRFSGRIAWMLWRAVYLMKMPTLSRKLGVALDWFMSGLFRASFVRVGDYNANRIRREHYAAGDTIYRQGQPSRTLYLIEHGTADVHKDGMEDPVTTLHQGEQFGLSALEQADAQHSTTVIANSAVELIAIDRPQLREMSKDSLSRELVHQLEMRATRQSLQSVLDRFPRLQHLHVSDVMVQDHPFLEEGDTLQSALQKHTTAATLPVLSADGRLLGVCTKACLTMALAKGLPPATHVSDFMSAAAITFLPEEPLRAAIITFLRSELDLLPVVSADRRWLGMFGVIETARWLMQQEQE